MALGASKMKFYNLVGTRSVGLTVNCYSDVKKGPQHSDMFVLTRSTLKTTNIGIKKNPN